MLQPLRSLLAGRTFGALVLGLLMLRSTVAGACLVQDLCVPGDHGRAVASLAAGTGQAQEAVDVADASSRTVALASPAGATDLESPCHCDCGHTPTALPAAVTLPAPPAATAAVAVRHDLRSPGSTARVLRPPIA